MRAPSKRFSRRREVLGAAAVSICTLARDLVVEPADAAAAGIPEDGVEERNLGLTRALVDVAAARASDNR